MADDSKKFGVLDNFTAFHFENYMSKILHILRKPHKPLEQIVRRKTEMGTISKKMFKNEEFPKLFHSSLHLNNLKIELTKIEFSKFTLKTNFPDNRCGLQDGSVVLIEKFITESKITYFFGKRFIKTVDFFTKPCLSSELGIYLVKKDRNFHRSYLSEVNKWNINEICVKYIALNYRTNCLVLLPLVHTV